MLQPEFACSRRGNCRRRDDLGCNQVTTAFECGSKRGIEKCPCSLRQCRMNAAQYVRWREIELPRRIVEGRRVVVQRDQVPRLSRERIVKLHWCVELSSFFAALSGLG